VLRPGTIVRSPRDVAARALPLARNCLLQGIAAACGASWLALAAIHRRFASGLLLSDPMREARS